LSEVNTIRVFASWPLRLSSAMVLPICTSRTNSDSARRRVTSVTVLALGAHQVRDLFQPASRPPDLPTERQ
jgi:hypothetical protein